MRARCSRSSELDNRGLADPHCHTLASDGMVTPAELVEGALKRGLALIAVTDHETMGSVRETVSRGDEAGLAVVPGQEVTTGWPAQTHVLGWFLEQPVRSGMSLLDTVKAIQAQGGLAVIPHPFLPTYFASCQPGQLARLLESTHIDGIELMHRGPMTRARRETLARFCAENREGVGALIGSSDSHFGGHDLGRLVTAFPGRTTDDFRAAVEERRTEPQRGANQQAVPFGLKLRQQRRGLIELPVRRLLGRL